MEVSVLRMSFDVCVIRVQSGAVQPSCTVQCRTIVECRDVEIELITALVPPFPTLKINERRLRVIGPGGATYL